MKLDVRLPIGLMFSLFGLILAVLGLVQGSEQTQRLFGLNLDLAWGLVILAFGLVMLVIALRARKRTTATVPPVD